jgi:hypothetical protein
VKHFDHDYFRECIAKDIELERVRQDALRDMGKFDWTLADAGQYSPSDAIVVLGEEFGEISEVVCEGLSGKPVDSGHLREEIIQLAACCVAWVEALDAEVASSPVGEADPDYPGHLDFFGVGPCGVD